MSYDLTPQEIFDKVVTHLYTQKKRAFDSIEDSCKYRTDDGLKCAVGALIEDADYQKSFDKRGGSVTGLLEFCRFKSKPLKTMIKNNERLLKYLQYEHDDSSNWSIDGPNGKMYRNLMRSVVNEFRLNPDVLDRMAGKND